MRVKQFENSSYKDLSRSELKVLWSKKWGKKAPPKIGRKMMIVSLEYKDWVISGGGLNKTDQKRIDRLVKAYKKNPNYFDRKAQANTDHLGVGTKLARIYKGVQHVVYVRESGFEYKDEIFSSLSKLAHHITGTKWNGKVFFGVK